jgi:hypothetical protein
MIRFLNSQLPGVKDWKYIVDAIEDREEQFLSFLPSLSEIAMFTHFSQTIAYFYP